MTVLGGREPKVGGDVLKYCRHEEEKKKKVKGRRAGGHYIVLLPGAVRG